jgi:hypothetical protein
MGKKISGGKTGQRGGDKIHGYAIAKLLKMKFLITKLVIKVI